MVTKIVFALLLAFAAIAGSSGNLVARGPRPMPHLPKLPRPSSPVHRPALRPDGPHHDTHIIGGKQVLTNQFPWMVLLEINDQVWCGGSIIDKHWVLTSASCISWADWAWITAGSRDLMWAQETQATLFSTKFVTHEKFSYNDYNYDVGLVYSHVPIPFFDNMAPAKLPAQGEADLPAREKVRAIGFGIKADPGYYSTNLRYVDVPIVANEQCASVYGNMITDQIICTGSVGAKNVCDGDFGGPLHHNGTDGWVIRGLVSFVSGAGCESGYPSGYTNVAQNVDWIKENMKRTF